MRTNFIALVILVIVIVSVSSVSYAQTLRDRAAEKIEAGREKMDSVKESTVGGAKEVVNIYDFISSHTKFEIFLGKTWSGTFLFMALFAVIMFANREKASLGQAIWKFLVLWFLLRVVVLCYAEYMKYEQYIMYSSLVALLALAGANHKFFLGLFRSIKNRNLRKFWKGELETEDPTPDASAQRENEDDGFTVCSSCNAKRVKNGVCRRCGYKPSMSHSSSDRPDIFDLY